MDLSTFHALLTPAGQAALQSAATLEPREPDFLQHFTALSRQYPAELARAALEVSILRREAAGKFPRATEMYFTREALEQASPSAVSAWRARRFTGTDRLVDLGCSVGGDTQALAQIAFTTGIDLDPLRLAMARANLNALGLGEHAGFVQADLRRALPLRAGENLALFFDPARRAAGRRIYSVSGYQPPLSTVFDWLRSCPALGVKISPGVQVEELSPYPAEVEFISLNGELKEAALWFGPLRSAQRRATLLPGEESLSTDRSWEDLERLPLAEPQAFLYEPDPAVLRAGLVGELGRQLGAFQLDEDIAYLTAGRQVATPFARCWAVDGWLPFSMKRLRAALRARGVGRLTVKKRGSPLQPEQVIREMKLTGDNERVVFLTHLRAKPAAIICYPAEPAA